MTAATIGYPPIQDPVTVAEWRDYERRNTRANASYVGVENKPECPGCGRLSDTRGGHSQHVRQCRFVS